MKVAKLGIDPTAPDLHLGHAAVLKQARKLQDNNYILYLIFGGYTATVGDPTGRNKERPKMTKEEVAANATAYKEQAFKILNPERTVVLDNITWLETLPLSLLMKYTSNVTIAQMLERRDFKQRYNNKTPINLTEFLYPILQGIDSVFIANHAKRSLFRGEQLEHMVELGGTDQLFNIQMGASLMELEGHTPQEPHYVPLLIGTDGVEKMSKSKGNYIPLSGDPYEVYLKLMRLPDNLLEGYREAFDIGSMRHIDSMKERHEYLAANIMLFICKFSPQEIYEAKRRYDSVSFGAIDSDKLTKLFVNDAQTLPHLLKNYNILPSVSEGKRLIKQRGMKLNGEVIEEEEIILQGEHTLEIGKSKAVIVVVNREEGLKVCLTKNY